VKSIVTKTKEINSTNLQSQPEKATEVPSDQVKNSSPKTAEANSPPKEEQKIQVVSNDSKANSLAVQPIKEKDDNSSEENSSFYDEVFYDAVSENTPMPEKVIQNMSVQEPDIRTGLPVKRSKRKFSFWVILKDMIGKDLTKISLPVYFNEPSGLLQRTCEGFENEYLLEKAANEKNPYLKLAYIAAFNANQYNGCLGRDMKPFNPLLGETFEYVTDKYRFFSEQVSHHPPISACHCESKYYTVYFNTQVSNKFWGNSLSFKPMGRTYIHFKNTDEDFVVDRPNTDAHNIIFGKLYLDLSGESVAENLKTGDKCIVKFKSKGWKADSLGLMEGVVVTKSGEKKFTMGGKWCDSIWVKNLETGDTIPIWKKFPLPENWEDYYCFTLHAIQLNYLTEKLKKVIAPTDSRFRPDQRAYENGDIKLASIEKNRLEEKQRTSRKEMEKKKIEYKPVYFVLSVDPITKEKNYIFNGKYWIDREKGNWAHLPNIY